jgi:hypothetical protein
LLLAATACDSDAANSAAGDAGADAATVAEDGGTGTDGLDTTGETSDETASDETSSDDTAGLTVGHDSESTGSSATSNTASSATSGSTDVSDTVSATDGHSDTSGSGTDVITSGTGSASSTSPGSDTGSGTEPGSDTDTESVTDTGAATDTDVDDTDVTSTDVLGTDSTSEPGTTATSSDVASSTADTSTVDTSSSSSDGGVSSGETLAVSTDTALSDETAPPDDTGSPGIMFEDNFDAEALDSSGYTFNYTTFEEWTVIGGTVDLISFPNQLLLSPGGYGDNQPADGVTVDLNGSNLHDGVLETQRSFTFYAGVTYRIGYALGSPYAETNGVRVEVMDVFSAEVSQNGIVPFAGYSSEFTADTTTTAKLRITSLGDDDNVGLFLDAVTLERLP